MLRLRAVYSAHAGRRIATESSKVSVLVFKSSSFLFDRSQRLASHPDEA
jgi:hypothetical protein